MTSTSVVFMHFNQDKIMLLSLIFAVFTCSGTADCIFSGCFLKRDNILTVSREKVPNLITIQIFAVAILFITVGTMLTVGSG